MPAPDPGYLWALLAHNLKAGLVDRGRVALMAGLMFLQNLVFLVVWVVLFGAVGEVRGWQLQDVALLFAITSLSVGGAMLIADGSRYLALTVRAGELDGYLTRPRHPLPQLLLSRANPAGLGDMAFGLLLLCGPTGLDAGTAMLALLLVLPVAAILLSVLVATQSLVFYLPGGSRLADYVFEVLICLAVVPQHAQGVVMKVVLFTVLPAGFMVLLPVTVLRDPGQVWILAAMPAAAAAYALAAVKIFERGLKRYQAG